MSLESIQNYCAKENFSGNTHIQCVPVQWVEDYPEFAKDGHNFSTQITLKAGKVWLLFPCAADTLDFDEKERSTSHGSINTPTISGFVPNDTPQIASVLNSAKANQWIVILYYKTGEAKVIGSLDTPARFSSSLNNRGNLNSGKGYDIEFFSQSSAKSFFVEETPDPMANGCLPVTISINSDDYFSVPSGYTQNLNLLDLNEEPISVFDVVGADIVVNGYRENKSLTWKVRTFESGASNPDQFTIPTRSGETYDFNVDWGDGTTDSNVMGDITHTFPYEGVFEIKISGTFPTPYFNDTGDKLKLIEISRFGSILMGNAIGAAYRGCKNCEITATDLPNLSNTVNIQDLWRDMDLLTWSPIVKDLFNGSSVISARFAFYAMDRFNQDLNDLDVSNITNLERFLAFSVLFNHYCGDWQLNSSLTDMSQIFRNTGMSTANYTDTLVGWANTIYSNGGAPNSIDMSNQSGMTFDTTRSGGANFPNAGAARDYLINTLSCTISGDTVI